MKKFKLIWLSIFAGIAAYGQVEDGPHSGNSFSVVAISGSSNTWTNAGNSGNSDNAYAQFGNLPSTVGSFTDYLVISNFLFAIPPGTTITGIVVDIERSDPSHRTSDYSIRILKNGTIGSGERSIGAPYSTNDNSQSYGDPADLWGETWTAAEINDPGFGIAIAAKRNFSTNATGGRIDDVQITLYYTFLVTPVNLLSFAAAKKEKAVDVTWTTAEEVQMDHYEIERSPNGRDFIAIGSVKSLQQVLQANYSFVDKNPLAGTSYYRLKMMGAGTDIRYSKIVSIQFNGQTIMALYPNPLQHGQSLSLVNPDNEQLAITFYSISGQRIANVTTVGNTIPVQGLQNQRGMVLYRIVDKNGNIAGTGKLLVQ